MKAHRKASPKTDLAELIRDMKQIFRKLKRLNPQERETLEVLLDPKAMAAIREARRVKTVPLKASKAFRNLL